jgi:Flp pilus assembly protein CpaB
MSGPLQRTPMQAPPVNGHRAAAAGLAAPSSLSTRVRPKGYAALAVALLVGCGALGFWLYTSAGQKVPVVEAARDIPVGHTISRADLTTVEVSGDITAVAGSHLSSLEGQQAAVGIRQGTPIQRSMVTSGSALPAGDGLVGVSAAPGQIPSSGLSPGDKVEVLQLPQKGTGPTSGGSTGSGGGSSSPQAVLVKSATVYDVRANTASSGGTLLTLVVPQDAAYGVAQASNAGLIALVKIGS